MAQAVSLWQQLTASKSYSFGDYANFLLYYPGFPDADKLQGFAEDRLRVEAVPARPVGGVLRQVPAAEQLRPRAIRAGAASSRGRRRRSSRSARRGAAARWTLRPKATLLATYGRYFTQDDQDARMDALLWQRDAAGAARQMAYISPARRPVSRRGWRYCRAATDSPPIPPRCSRSGLSLQPQPRAAHRRPPRATRVSLLANRPHALLAAVRPGGMGRRIAQRRPPRRRARCGEDRDHRSTRLSRRARTSRPSPTSCATITPR